MTENKDKEEFVRDLHFDVMPDISESGSGEAENSENMVNPNASFVAPNESDHSAENTPVSKAGKKHSWRGPLVFLIVIVALGIAGYFVYQKFFQNKPANTGPVVEVSPEQTQVTDGSQGVQNPASDEDQDGLVLERETNLGTDPKNPDNDNDGLSDGDEVNIYESNPLLYDTDNDGFNDGKEVAGGYSPVENSPDLASQEEVAKWQSRIDQFGLHSPTDETLLLNQSTQNGDSVSYDNKLFGYTIQIPSILTVREFNNGQKVGLHVTGTTPSDSDVMTDPISISLAVKTEGDSLSGWLQKTYVQGQNYSNSSFEIINGIDALRIYDLAGEGCVSDQVLFPNGNRLITLTLTCNNNDQFKGLFEQIVKSFNFNISESQ